MSYLDYIKENASNMWDKIKNNTFVNMAFPVREISEGQTEAGLMMVVPGASAANTVGRLAVQGVRPPQLQKNIIRTIDGFARTPSLVQGVSGIADFVPRFASDGKRLMVPVETAYGAKYGTVTPFSKSQIRFK